MVDKEKLEFPEAEIGMKVFGDDMDEAPEVGAGVDTGEGEGSGVGNRSGVDETTVVGMTVGTGVGESWSVRGCETPSADADVGLGVVESAVAGVIPRAEALVSSMTATASEPSLVCVEVNDPSVSLASTTRPSNLAATILDRSAPLVPLCRQQD